MLEIKFRLVCPLCRFDAWDKSFDALKSAHRLQARLGCMNAYKASYAIIDEAMEDRTKEFNRILKILDKHGFIRKYS